MPWKQTNFAIHSRCAEKWRCHYFSLSPACRAFRVTVWGCTRRGQEKAIRAFPLRETLAKRRENFPKLQVSFCAPGTIPFLHTSNDMCRALRVWDYSQAEILQIRVCNTSHCAKAWLSESRQGWSNFASSPVSRNFDIEINESWLIFSHSPLT